MVDRPDRALFSTLRDWAPRNRPFFPHAGGSGRGAFSGSRLGGVRERGTRPEGIAGSQPRTGVACRSWIGRICACLKGGGGSVEDLDSRRRCARRRPARPERRARRIPPESPPSQANQLIGREPRRTRAGSTESARARTSSPLKKSFGAMTASSAPARHLRTPLNLRIQLRSQVPSWCRGCRPATSRLCGRQSTSSTDC